MSPGAEADWMKHCRCRDGAGVKSSAVPLKTSRTSGASFCLLNLKVFEDPEAEIRLLEPFENRCCGRLTRLKAKCVG